MDIVKPMIAFTAILVSLWGCILNNSNATGNTYMDVRLDQSWLGYDSLHVFLVDSTTSAKPQMIFHGPIATLHDLSHVPIQGYHGQFVQVLIIGFKGGHADREVTRSYEGDKQQTVKRDSIEHRPQPGLKLDLQPDRILIYKGGPTSLLSINPVEAWIGKVITWRSDDETKAKVDGKGVVTGIGEGTTYVWAIYNDTLRDSTLVKVVKDAPSLDVGLDTAVLLNTTILFSVKASQSFGTYQTFAWDLDGNGSFDDSTIAFPKDQTVFSAPPKKYPQPGSYILRFYIRDGEGNETIAERRVTVANQVPRIDSLTESRTVIVGDTAAFSVKVSVLGGGTLKSYAWDYEGDGTFEDTGSVSTALANLNGGHTYRKSGSYTAVFKLTDASGTSVSRAIVVEVKPDPADAYLSSLTLSTGPLSPAFRKEVPTFTSIVTNGLRDLNLYVEAESGLASVSVNGKTSVLSAESVNLVLQTGTNKISIKVLAENAKDSRTYEINVTVPPNGEGGL